MFAKLTGLAAFALAVSSALADPTCLTTERRSAPGRDVSFGNYKCSNQIKTCAALCKGGEPSANTCVSNNEGVDNPFKAITYCFECVCADGSTPELAKYYDTIPYEVCSLSLQNCQYIYNQGGQVAPDGACPTCGDQYAVEPTWMTWTPTWTPSETTSTPAPTTSSAEVEAVTTSGGVEVVTSSADASGTAVSSSTSAPETTSSTSSEVSSAQTTTVQLSTTILASNTTSALTTHSPSPSGSATTTAVAPVKSAGAASVEPAMAVFGMVLAAAFAL